MMKQVQTTLVPDHYDQDLAQIVHRVGVRRVTIEYQTGQSTTYEAAPSENDLEV